MKIKLSLYLFVGLLVSCKPELSESLFLESWNTRTLNIIKTRECPVINSYNLELIINENRVIEASVIFNLIGLNNVDIIIESALSGSLLERKLKVIDKNDVIHSFDYLPEYSSYRYKNSSKYRTNGNLTPSNNCEIKDSNYQYFYVRTKMKNSKIENIGVFYY